MESVRWVIDGLFGASKVRGGGRERWGEGGRERWGEGTGMFLPELQRKCHDRESVSGSAVLVRLRTEAEDDKLS